MDRASRDFLMMFLVLLTHILPENIAVFVRLELFASSSNMHLAFEKALKVYVIT